MKKILILCNDRLISDDLRGVLTRFGYDIKITKKGIEGIYMLTDEHFDAVIIDMLTSSIDGDDVDRHVRLMGKKKTPMIFINKSPDYVINIALEISDMMKNKDSRREIATSH